MTKSIYLTLTIFVFMTSLAACQSVTGTTDTTERGDLSSDTTMLDTAEATPTPEPEAEMGIPGGTTIASAEPVFAPSEPVKSLGASSSGLGR